MERSRVYTRTTGASVRKNQVDVGKYARMTEMTMGKAYVTDKKYVKWVRHNIKTEGSTPGMRKFRLYVELRDQTKSERIHGTMGLGMTGTQMPVPAMPKRMAKSKAAPSDPRAHQGYMTPPSVNHRRPREGEGWGAEMPENPMGADHRGSRRNRRAARRVDFDDQREPPRSHQGEPDESGASSDGHQEGSGDVQGDRPLRLSDAEIETLMKGLDEMTVGKSAELDVMIMNLGEEFLNR